MPLKVTIIGGGLAGLLAGRVLRDQHDVTILERFNGGHELGAAINLGPSALKIAKKYGLDTKRAGSIVADTARTFLKNGKQVRENDMGKFSKLAGEDWVFQHRADLWEEFLRLATGPGDEVGSPGKPCTVLWGSDVVNVDVDTGDVSLADGTTLSSDLVIGADGVKSIVRPLVVGEDDFRTASPSGLSAFRFTIPAYVYKNALPDETRVLDATKNASLDVHLGGDSTNRSVVLYPCRGFQLVNFVCIAPDNLIKTKTSESWSAKGTVEDLLDTYHDFHYLKPVLAEAKNIMLWQLRDQDPLPTYIKGRTVLIGDAAHAMTPHQGQGGTQAVEDAEGFELFNMHSVARDAVSSVLQDFDIIRRNRAGQVQSNTREAHDRKDPETMYKHTAYNWVYKGIQESLELVRNGESIKE
ncbi:hypothetical protein N7474_005005 [Penicillium riverlandense]|uniref:uncharacterized protein n=1 Tax=Penicillium riverlandense TaxID=1903569 RepID=UPI002547FB1F|nr:uncharacterized protein N7474_005005 [Penicillium riverlandense]KAJ5819414.1 hypothetical protein N7474_005005 [Penicillium riverlandense]